MENQRVNELRYKLHRIDRQFSFVEKHIIDNRKMRRRVLLGLGATVIAMIWLLGHLL